MPTQSPALTVRREDSPTLPIPSWPIRRKQTFSRFLILLACFSTIFAASWPIVFSLDMWAFQDRSSFLNLDYLLAKHLIPGVDTYYAYGLYPVLIQHLLFAAFGRGYGPMIGCAVVTMVLMAVFWALLLRRLSDHKLWLLSVLAISPVLFWVNPNFPYSLVQLSILFALLLVLKGRTDLAMAVAAIGCFSVPSLTLLLTGLLAVAILAEWSMGRPRSLSLLVRRLAPGIGAWVLSAVILGFSFGRESLLATALPTLGMKFYHASDPYRSIHNLTAFLHPPGHGIGFYAGYYAGAPAVWWAGCTLALLVFGFRAAYSSIRHRTADPRSTVVVVCAIMQAAFALVAFGSINQHVIFDPMTAAGTLVGISLLPSERVRRALLIVFGVVGLAGQSVQAHHTRWTWKNTARSAETAHLYAERGWTVEWKRVLRIAADHNVMVLSHVTGIHHYFPNIHNADAWFLVPGEIFPSDKRRLLSGVEQAEVVVEDTAHAPALFDSDPDVQHQLGVMCLTDVSEHFQTWWKTRPPGFEGACKVNPR